MPLCVSGLGDEVNPADQESDRVEKLEKRVAELEARVQQLEALLRKMADQPGQEVPKAMLKVKKAMCGDNLRQLWVLETVYMTQFGGRAKAMPSATGPAFWLALARTQPALIEESELDILVCPLSGKKSRPDFTTYRGPAKLMARLAGDDVVGCCEPGHHPDGTITVLKKNGEVLAVGPDDPVYKRALETTTAQGDTAEKK
jgi:hypothetical protein